MGGAAAGGLSIASAGLSAYSTVLKGEGTQAADEYQAESLERAANVGKVKAAQTGAQMTESLDNETTDPASRRHVAGRGMAQLDRLSSHVEDARGPIGQERNPGGHLLGESQQVGRIGAGRLKFQF